MLTSVLRVYRLADHSCARSSLPPALSSPPSSPPAPEPVALSAPASPPRAAPDVPEEPLDDEEPPTDDSTSTPRRQKKRSTDSGADKLDAFVPQTEDLVPEDILDAYGADTDEDDQVDDAQVAPTSAPGVPQDVADVPSDDLDTTSEPGAPRHPDQDTHTAEPMARSASTPGGAVARARKTSTKPRVQSAYGGTTKLPGRYYTSDDEMDGEPGSATIVRSPSSQRFEA